MPAVEIIHHNNERNHIYVWTSEAIDFNHASLTCHHLITIVIGRLFRENQQGITPKASFVYMYNDKVNKLIFRVLPTLGVCDVFRMIGMMCLFVIQAMAGFLGDDVD